MKYLLDTNILLCLVEIKHPHHKTAIKALKKLRQQNYTFCVLLQNVSEFWNVCTRPADRNGLGFSISKTDLQLKRFERLFETLPDTLDVYKNWRELVVNHSVQGVQVHDAKIAAALEFSQYPKSADF
jgi:predicted nucleic acid-binding protein